MNKLRACLAVSGASLLIVLCGMFSAPPAYAQGGDARRATPPAGRALVFVFRSDRETAAAEVPVFVNAEAVGQLANGTFLVATVNPGRTFVRVGDRVVSAVALQAEPNRSYFVRTEAVSGVRPVRTETRLVSEAEGRRSVAQSRSVGAAPGVIAAPRPTAPTPKPAPPPRVVKPAAPPAPAVKPAPPPRVAKPAPPPPAVRPSRAPVAREPEDAGWDIAIIAKAGNFKLANGSQVVGGLPSTYDTTSKPVFGMEIEWRSRAGLAFGGEVFYYKNELAATGTAFAAEQEVFAGMLNGKYYFRAADWFYPYIGAGIGFAGASYGGDLTGKASGPAYQGLAGMEFRFKGVGLHAQFKYLAATTDDGSGAKVKVGGSGVLAGVSIIF